MRKAGSHAEPPRVFRDMHEVREFRLVLRANVLGNVVERTMRKLEHAVGVERRNGGLDYLVREP